MLNSPNWQKIILIDDNTVLNLIHKKILNIIGFEGPVLDFNNGLQAIEYIRNNSEIKFSPVLVILDLEMPVLNGWEFLKNFDDLEPCVKSHFRIIVSSSITNQQQIKQVLEFDVVSAFIPKPLTIEKISKLIGGFGTVDCGKTN